MDKTLIAACGMNCGLCIGYLREKNKCPGCRKLKANGAKYCRKCIIKNCKILKENNWDFCSSKCDKYPCLRLKNLDKRYRGKYGMSMLENLENIEKLGVKKFVESEKKKWKCPKCKETVSVHRDICLKCGEKYR